MASALASVEIPVAINATKLLINRWVDSEAGKTFPTINPDYRRRNRPSGGSRCGRC